MYVCTGRHLPGGEEAHGRAARPPRPGGSDNTNHENVVMIPLVMLIILIMVLILGHSRRRRRRGRRPAGPAGADLILYKDIYIYICIYNTLLYDSYANVIYYIC